MQIRVAGGDAIFRCSGVALRFMGDGGKSLPTRAREPRISVTKAQFDGCPSSGSLRPAANRTRPGGV